MRQPVSLNSDEQRRTLSEFRRLWASLRPRQRTLIQRVVEGAPNKLIASELEISARTNDRLRADALAKLKIETAVELARCVGFAEAADSILATIRQTVSDEPSGDSLVERLKTCLDELESDGLQLPTAFCVNMPRIEEPICGVPRDADATIRNGANASADETHRQMEALGRVSSAMCQPVSSEPAHSLRGGRRGASYGNGRLAGDA